MLESHPQFASSSETALTRIDELVHGGPSEDHGYFADLEDGFT